MHNSDVSFFCLKPSVAPSAHRSRVQAPTCSRQSSFLIGSCCSSLINPNSPPAATCRPLSNQGPRASNRVRQADPEGRRHVEQLILGVALNECLLPWHDLGISLALS